MAKNKSHKPEHRGARKKPPGKKRGQVITEKESRFIDQYLIDLNATQAAIRAGFSDKSAKEIGYQLLHKTSLSQEVKRRQAILTAKLGLDAERVLKEVTKIAFANMRDFVDGFNPKDPSNLAPEDAAVVMEIAETRQGRRLKLHSKMKALEFLGKHMRLFYDRTEAVEALLASLPHELANAIRAEIIDACAPKQQSDAGPLSGTSPELVTHS
jgi:phage terminase small subunit